MEQVQVGKCVYILSTGKNVYKIGKTQDLHKRLAAYHTHLPVMFRVIRQYAALNMTDLEESLHIVFQHKRVKGEWFELSKDDLIICDNIARNYALQSLQKQQRKYNDIVFSDNPLLQVMEANEKYLMDYSRIADDVELGLNNDEIFQLHEGTVNKAIIDTVRRLLKYRTPNSAFLGKWLRVVNELSNGTSEALILQKYKNEVSRGTIQMIKRILRNQLY
ncbi:Meiotically Up-regulated Gene 113 (MUG113) protein [Chitinophaga polysaccharea]|uniref:Meiotically Up-regulated Gene 113 (MUG113) protein n=1 Tax=Chitinophaga polysaccharea TaxID=1293035 RepID=A0A561PA49_9BACT|nr:GIY-YIG nuclease family protein [Chitinophaga polysaccharea]TWF34948.1 Meiotically Up-regulated Gene 113 (MUG113) protein [Chitinophaga polysaccharea]